MHYYRTKYRYGSNGPLWQEYFQKWDNCRKYLKDFSFVKEYPPESVRGWNEYLVYGTALGVADNVAESMKELVYIGDARYDNSTYAFCYYGGFHSFSSAMDTGQTTVSAADSSSSGGVGGGSGGCGGGAF